MSDPLNEGSDAISEDATRAAASADVVTLGLVSASGTIAVLLVLSMADLRGIGGAGDWINTHWMFTWDHGFVKRGLVGSAYDMILGQTSLRTLTLTQGLIALLAAFSLALLTMRSLSLAAAAATPCPGQSAILKSSIFTSFILASPGLVQNWFWDLGRFDAIGFLMLAAAAGAIYTLRAGLALAVCLALSIIAVLVHEAFLMWVVPGALAIWYLRWGASWRALAAAVGVGVLAAAVTAIVWQYSYQRFDDLGTTVARLQQRAPFPISEDSVMVHFRSLDENVAFTMENAFGERRIAGLALGLVVLGGQTAMLLWLIWPALGRSAAKLAVVAALALCPLGLFALGHDHGRWLAMINATMVLLALSALRESRDLFRRMSEVPVLLMLSGSLVMLAVGPLGVTEIFPEAGVFSVLRWLAAG